MDKAKDENEDDRRVPTEPTKPRQPTWDEPSEYEKARQRERERERSRNNVPAPSFEGDLAIWAGIRGGSATGEGSSIGTYSDGDLFLSMDLTPAIDVVVYAGYKGGYPTQGSSLALSIKDPLFFLWAGIEGRFSPLPELPFFSPYMFGGIGAQSIFWTFKNPIISGSDTISSDGLGGAIMNVGLGVYLLNFERLRLGVNISPELYVFGLLTNQGFDNDFFGTYGTIKITGEVSVLF